MPQHGRILYRELAKHEICTVNWSIIDSRSYVVVTLAEAAIREEQTPSFVAPVERFIGAARHMLAANISPFNGGVRFGVHWDDLMKKGDYPYLNIWADITVFDPADPSAWMISDNPSVNFEQAHPDWRAVEPVQDVH
jgi:hypothetical protein